MSLAEVAAATGGTLSDTDGRNLVSGNVVVDSRQVAHGSLFVAIAGEHRDGHDYAGAASAAGAVGVLAGRPVGVPAVVVDGGAVGVTAALGRLAREVLRRSSDVQVTAVTGSSGKTSTKDLLAQLLAESGPTIAAESSFNNDLGVALTVLRLEPGVRHLVLEMGARGRGHIARLCSFAPPTVGVLLNIGTAHIGEFGSRAAIAQAKQELVEALPPEGAAVLNADDPLVAAMATASRAPICWYGRTAGSRPVDIGASEVRLDDHGRARFHLHTPTGRADVALVTMGEHQVSNALAAAAVGHHAGLDVERIAGALSAAGPRSRWRMEVSRRADGVTVINDAYNANPDSVRAALHALVASARGGRTWAVLGEMLELGTAATSEHERIGRLAIELGITRLVVVGAGATAIHVGAARAGAGRENAVVVADPAAARALLDRELLAGDTVLVKASNAIGLGHLGESLAGQAP